MHQHTPRARRAAGLAAAQRLAAMGVVAALALGLATPADAQSRPKPRIATAPATTKRPAAAAAATGTAIHAGTTMRPNLARIFERCCSIVSVDAASGQVIARHDATGDQFVFVAPRRPSLGRPLVGRALSVGGRYRPGQVVYRSLDGTAAATTLYPVSESETDEIGKSSRKMKTEVIVSADGSLKAKTRTWTSEALVGFTGGVVVALTDKDGKLLHFTKVRKYGVNGTAVPGAPSSKTVAWDETVPAAVMNQFSGIAIVHRYEPTPRWLETQEDVVEFAKYVKDAYDTISKILACYEELFPDEESTEPGAPPPPPGTQETTPPAPAACSDLLETTPAPGQPD